MPWESSPENGSCSSVHQTIHAEQIVFVKFLIHIIGGVCAPHSTFPTCMPVRGLL